MPSGVSDIFLQNGVLGACVVILILAVGYLFRELRKEQAAHIETLKLQLPVMEATNRSLAAITAATEIRARATDALTAVIERQTAEIEHLQKNVEAIRERRT